MKATIENSLRIEAARKIYEALAAACVIKLIYGTAGAAAYGVHPDGVIECVFAPYTEEEDTLSQHYRAMKYIGEMAKKETGGRVLC